MDQYSAAAICVVIFGFGFFVGHFWNEIASFTTILRGRKGANVAQLKAHSDDSIRDQAWRPKVVGDAPTQLRHVMAATFSKRKILSKSEYRVFRAIEEEVRARPGGFRVLAQTSLGEILATDDKLAFGSINSKRVDCLVIDPYGTPVAAVEYQGDAHHQGSAAACDAVKREALRKAGIHFVEIDGSHSSDEIKQLVCRLIFSGGREAPSIPQPSPRRFGSEREL